MERVDYFYIPHNDDPELERIVSWLENYSGRILPVEVSGWIYRLNIDLTMTHNIKVRIDISENVLWVYEQYISQRRGSNEQLLDKTSFKITEQHKRRIFKY